MFCVIVVLLTIRFAFNVVIGNEYRGFRRWFCVAFPKKEESWPRGNKTSLMLNSAENEICSAYKNINTNNLNFIPAKQKLSMKFFLLINIKMPTIVGILIFINRKNFMLS